MPLYLKMSQRQQTVRGSLLVQTEELKPTSSTSYVCTQRTETGPRVWTIISLISMTLLQIFATVCACMHACITDQSDSVLWPQHSKHGLKMFLEVTQTEIISTVSACLKEQLCLQHLNVDIQHSRAVIFINPKFNLSSEYI